MLEILHDVRRDNAMFGEWRAASLQVDEDLIDKQSTERSLGLFRRGALGHQVKIW